MTSEPNLRFDLHLPLQRFALEVSVESSCQCLGIFGPSGSGKTSLLEAIAGLRVDATGVARCNEVVWQDSAAGLRQLAHKRDIGYLAQEHLLFPHLSAAENLRFGEKRARHKGLDTEANFREVVETLELAGLVDRPVDSLSGGERQRIALGRALCSGPRLLLLDEPLASLDVALRWRILPYLKRVRERFGIPMLIVSHNPSEILALCDEAIALENGLVVARGSPVELFAQASVFAAASKEGIENIAEGVVLEQGRHVTKARLGKEADDPVISIPQTDCPTGQQVTLGLPANDILISVQPAEGLSARNAVPAKIQALQPAEKRMVATTLVEGSQSLRVIVELTIEAVEELELVEGKTVWLVLKSSSITVHALEP